MTTQPDLIFPEESGSLPTDTPDTSDPGQVPTLVSVNRWKALSFFNQIREYWVLLFRRAFHLPIDDLKEARIEQRFDALLQLAESNQQALEQLASNVRGIDRRLSYHEQHIPRMRELKQQLVKEEMGIRKPSNGSRLITS